MPAFACLTKERHLKKGIIFKRSHCRGSPVHSLPDAFEESRETSVCLANINVDILALPGSVSPHCGRSNRFGSKPYASHRCKADPARNDGILAIEAQLSTAIRR